MQKYLVQLTKTTSRMALMSNGDLLRLLSISDVNEALAIVQRECFPLLRELKEVEDKTTAINVEGKFYTIFKIYW